MKTKETVIAALIFIFLIVGCGVWYHISTISKIEKDNLSFIAALNDTVKYYSTKNGEQAASIEVFETQSVDQFLKIRSKDSLLTELQNRVSQYKKKLDDMTLFEAIGQVSSAPKTEVIRDSDFVFPVYKSRFLDSWIDLSITATKDSIPFSLEYREKYAVTQLKDKNGDYVEIVSLSPYVKVDNIRSFRLTNNIPKTKRWGLSLYGGFGTVYYDKKVVLGPEIGIGVTYDIFQW